jgi:hypothetical protein
MPVSRIEQAEGTQIVEEMLTKIAKKVHITNYNTFVSVLGKDVMSDLQVLNKRFFYRDATNSHPIRTTGALLEKVTARDLNSLRPSNAMRKLFEEQVIIEPHYIQLNNMNLLVPRMEELWIENRSLKNSISIDYLLSSTPEIIFFIS